MEQQSLLDEKLSKLDQQFWDFHKKNPEVLRQLVDLTRQAKARGRRKIGMKQLFEIIRWNKMIQTNGGGYKMNNNYTSRYTRIIEEKYPDLAGMFEKRRIHS